MKITQLVGLPVLKVISYGQHPNRSHALVSTLMTRSPGKDLRETYDRSTAEERKAISTKLRSILRVMLARSSPWGVERICSVAGTVIRSIRLPYYLVGPRDSECDFNDCLISIASARKFAS